MRRREFLTIPKHAVGGLLLYTLAGEPIRLVAQENGNVKVPLRFFSAAGGSHDFGGMRANLSERCQRPWCTRSSGGDLY